VRGAAYLGNESLAASKLKRRPDLMPEWGDRLKHRGIPFCSAEMHENPSSRVRHHADEGAQDSPDDVDVFGHGFIEILLTDA